MRIVVYDKTQGWLTWSWRIGAWLLRLLGRSDRIVAVDSWDGFFQACRENKEQLDRIEYWGHGYVGSVSCNGVRLNSGKRLKELARFMAPGALLWWRTCSCFYGDRGYAFAKSCVNAIGCRVAGHTFIIWLWQSGLHVLAPGAEPGWPKTEGRKDGKGLWGWPGSPSSLFLLRRGPK